MLLWLVRRGGLLGLWAGFGGGLGAEEPGSRGIALDSEGTHAYGEAVWNAEEGTLALRGEVQREVWRDGWVAPLAEGLHKGDWLWIRVRARAVEAPGSETGEVRLPWMVEELKPPRERVVDAELRAGPAWADLMAFGRVERDIGPGEAGMLLHTGAAKGVVELKDVEVRRYPPDTDPSTLPRTPLHWEGREPDAAWRKWAENRIRMLRRGDLLLALHDEDGRPLAHREVKLRMRKHRFQFGTAVNAGVLLREDADAERYRRELAANFEWATVENALKWEAEDWGMVNLRLPAVKMLSEMGLEVRGHVLVWPSYENSPQALKEKSPGELEDAIRRRVKEATREMRPWIREWDAVNEPWSHRDFMEVLGEELVAKVFYWAAEALPEGRFHLNDYGILNEGRLHTTHKDAYADWIDRLLEWDAPVKGVGLQGHFGAQVPDVSQMRDTLERFGAFGLPLTITEFDHTVHDEEAQADFLRDVLTLCFADPGVDGFFMWGFWDGRHWKNNAPLFQRDWTPKPALKVWRRLVWEEWRTPDQVLTPDAEGRVRVPDAFYGEYTLEAGENLFRVQHRAGGAGKEVLLRPEE